jgi:catechol 2,3-dioxygenase-like lactoylglutathione lyase family enzyme
MAFLSMRPLIRTNSLPDTLKFYTEILDFSVGEKNDEWQWARLYKDQVEIMIAGPSDHDLFDQPNFTGSFYFTVDQIDDLWDSLKDKANVCYPIETFEWEMKEFAIFDNNGYLLQFGQEMPSF